MDQVEALSKKIRTEARHTRKRAEEIREKEGVVQEVEEERFTGKLIGVDGGLITKSLHGIDLIITRACAVNMRYEDGKLDDYSYFPGPNPQLKTYSADPTRGTKQSNLLRSVTEIETALKSLKKYPCDYLLLDGSITPSPTDKPNIENEEERKRYLELIDKYVELYRAALDQAVQVVGVVEDSKSRKIARVHGEDMLDSVLLHYVLNGKERTHEFNYSDQPGNHPVLSDFPPEIRNKMKAMYLKPSENDRPLRIEYISGIKQKEDVSAMINYLSTISTDYSYPAPLIEADLHAKLSREEFESIIDELKALVGEEPLLMERRRDKRPFK